MIPATFDYVRPASVDEAVTALAEGGEDAKILAGGQSLIPVLRLRLAAPSTLVDLGGIAELRGSATTATRIVIGAMTTHYDVLGDDLVQEHARCSPRPRRRWPTPRCATAAPSAARWRTPTRPVTSARRRSRSTRSS